MKRFSAKIVDMMKQENLYASQGGPIILSQVFLKNFIKCMSMLCGRIFICLLDRMVDNLNGHLGIFLI